MFIHFFHGQLFTLYQILERVRPRAALVDRLRHALHWSVFLTHDALVMPTTDLVQSPVSAAFMKDLRFLADCDLLYFVGSTVDVDDLQASKRAHFGGTSMHPQWSQGSAKRRLRSFQRNMNARSVDTTTDVKIRWKGDVAALDRQIGTFAMRQLRHVHTMLDTKPGPSQYESALYDIPEKLGAHAFLWNVIEDLKIFPFETSSIARRHFELALGWNWAHSYLDEYGTTMVGRIPGIGYVDCGLRSTDSTSLVDLVTYDAVLRVLGLTEVFAALSLADLVRLREDPRVILFEQNVLGEFYRLLSRTGRRNSSALPYLRRLADSTRDRVQSAHSPVDAMIAAALSATEDGKPLEMVVRRGRSTAADPPAVLDGLRPHGVSSQTPQPEERPTVAVLVALVEELDTVLTLIEALAGPLTIIEDEETGRAAYLTPYGPFRLLFALVGRGQERSAVSAALVIANHRPVLTVSLGIAGALSEELSIGDVVIGDQVVSYLANAKAVPDGGSGFIFRMAGDPLRSDDLLVERAVQLPFLRRSAFAASRERVARATEKNPEPPMRAGGYGLVAGPVACGPVVGAATEFRNWLLLWKRDLIALDMETSGIAAAASALGTLRRVRFLALRGISDLADEDKSRLEQSTKGSARRLAMRTSLEVLLLLLDSLPDAILR
ncbi:hypothetical protein [Acrocarpospora sp. B8E8]|uniref:5'-methylthioadenosine/S-adenosylhomocysteine nucleosidase family protein n=1 Tax=Acrocarpospora sp. B8E8 TaxID=3153572 RepID=UPI00325EB5E0